MNSVHTPVEPDRRNWHLDKTLNISHILTTLVIAGSLFAYANNMERRVAILEEKVRGLATENQRSQTEVKELAADVRRELSLLRTEVLRLLATKSPPTP